MEKSRKNLRFESIIIVLFAALSLIQIIADLIWGDINSATVPAGAPANILMITKIVILAVTVLLLLPKFYVGFKGMKVAKNPDKSKAHITWAKIVFVFAILGFIDPTLAIINGGNLGDNLSTICSYIVEAIIYSEYIKFAKEVSKLAE